MPVTPTVTLPLIVGMFMLLVPLATLSAEVALATPVINAPLPNK